MLCVVMVVLLLISILALSFGVLVVSVKPANKRKLPGDPIGFVMNMMVILLSISLLLLMTVIVCLTSHKMIF